MDSKNRRLNRDIIDFGYLPMTLAIDNQRRVVLGGTKMRKGDLVVVVGKARDPLILRGLGYGEELESGSEKKKSREIETLVYQY